jgi:2,3-bisphosphoglycerate-independent phosphoglycerate mutase
MRRTIALIVLDGWGIGQNSASNPIHVANLQHFKYLEENYPMGSLQASGISVGLPWGEVGNSEVGHLTLGAGKVVYQYYPKITLAIRDGSFFENQVLKELFTHARKNGGAVHFVGLLTKANTHASLEHLTALIEMGEKENIPVNLHLFADGIDSPPRTLSALLQKIPQDNLATLTGRYYAMDREQNWQLVEQAYNCIVGKSGADASNLSEALRIFGERTMSDEFFPPSIVRKEKCVKEGDAVFFFNYREDSIREISEAFIAPDFKNFPTAELKNVAYATMTRYESVSPAPVAFPADTVLVPLGKVLSDAGKNQLRLAETFKYAHVAYFFNGHEEEPFPNEYRVLVPSLKTTDPAEHPELMAREITNRLVEAIQNQAFDFILVNYSNPDTIGHTGNYEAAIEAAKVVDAEIGKVVDAAEGSGALLIITSDHGNLEQVLNPMTGRSETQHDANPVPIHFVGAEFKGRKFVNQENLKRETTGVLSDVAPTILALMDIQKPPEMTGENLLRELM